MIVNFVQFPGISAVQGQQLQQEARGSQDYSLVSRPGPHILIRSVIAERVGGFYNMSVIIDVRLSSDV